MTRLIRQTLSIIGWSVASCGLTLAVLLPTSTHATSPADAKHAEIAQPKLLEGGVELTMQVSDNGSVLLIASNRGDGASAIHPKFECRSLSVSDRMSRVPRPQTIWTHEQTITLGAGEVKRVALPKNLAFNAGDSIFVTTESTKDAVVLLIAPLKLAQAK